MGSHPYTSTTTQNDLKVPPAIASGGGGRHTSVVGTHGRHREFIVYDGMQAYPEYEIRYRRDA